MTLLTLRDNTKKYFKNWCNSVFINIQHLCIAYEMNEVSVTQQNYIITFIDLNLILSWVGV